MHSLLKNMHDSKTKVVYLDETMFTFSTFRAKSWSSNKDSLKINDKNLKIKTLALIAAISEDGGLVDFAIHPKAINTESFVTFIHSLTAKLGGGDFAIFLDNLSVHKTKEAKLVFEENNITEIFNVPYSP